MVLAQYRMTQLNNIEYKIDVKKYSQKIFNQDFKATFFRILLQEILMEQPDIYTKKKNQF